MMIDLVSTIIGIGVIPMCSWIAEAENDFFISPDEKSMQGVILNAPIKQPQDFDYPNCQGEGSAEGKISPSNMDAL
jgi:hypothetical protein